MSNKCEDNDMPASKGLLCIDSYDGAEHVRSYTNRFNVISYNSQLISKSMIEKGSSASGSFGILTWTQTLCKEKFFNVVPVVKLVYREKSDLMKLEEIDGHTIYF